MKIANILKQKHSLLKCFRPNETDMGNLKKTIQDLATLNPDFMSVTYGALGTTTDNSSTPSPNSSKKTQKRTFGTHYQHCIDKSRHHQLCNEVEKIGY